MKRFRVNYEKRLFGRRRRVRIRDEVDINTFSDVSFR